MRLGERREGTTRNCELNMHVATLLGACWLPQTRISRGSDIRACVREQNLHEHEAELGLSLSRFPMQPVRARWSTEPSSTTYSVGEGNAGPDEAILKCGHAIHATQSPVISQTECEAIVLEAREAMEAGMMGSFKNTAASNHFEVHTHDLPKAREWLATRLYDTIFPLLGAFFGDPSDDDNCVNDPSELFVYDSLVIWYGAEHGGTRQPTHRDGSLLSVNIALSPPDAFEGGGTFFESLTSDCALQQPQGHAMCHASGARHSGASISAGERWVLVIFVNARRAVMHARCAAQLCASIQASPLPPAS